VCCTHLGLDRDERIKQVEAICRIVDALHGPLLLVGDFNDTPNSPPIARILEAGFVDAAGPSPTFMAPNPREKIDYLFTRGFAAVGSPQVVPSLFSDHLPVWAEVEIAAEKKETSPEPAT
jgi:endonuclease/exonuclease/phosphatase family metal-dependent hydrolase